jgi:hypothetical protein
MAGTHKAHPVAPDAASTIPIEDEDIIDVVVGADEERAQVRKRRHEHAPPEEAGVPHGADLASEAIDASAHPHVRTSIDSIDDEERPRGARAVAGAVVEDIANADTLRNTQGEEDRRLRALRQRRRD